MLRSRRPFARPAVLVAAGAAGFAASWAGLDISLSRVTTSALSFDRTRSLAPVPEEVAMPAAAPDDPAAYRGSRFRTVDGVRGPSVEAGGKAVPWLRTLSIEHPSGSDPFGFQVVDDGRRWMVWFFRTAKPSCCPAWSGTGPEVAVMDVLVLRQGWRSADGRRAWEMGCGPDGDHVIIQGAEGRRLNRGTGRIGAIDPDDARCPDD